MTYDELQDLIDEIEDHINVINLAVPSNFKSQIEIALWDAVNYLGLAANRLAIAQLAIESEPAS